MRFGLIAVGIPSNNLQRQFKREILKVFPDENNVLLVGGDGTTDKHQIMLFANNRSDAPKFIITTYSSCHLLVDSELTVDFKIGDEAHHLVGIEREENRGFRLFHKIQSDKTLFMTATEKTMETQTPNKMYSMDDETVFGKYIDVKSVNWAIEHKKITDYCMLVLKHTEDTVDGILSNIGIQVSSKDLFVSALMCLKSIVTHLDLTHILLYTNTIADAELAKQYIDIILSLNIISISPDQLYNNVLHNKNCSNLDIEVSKFKSARYGIISCVCIFGEGFDLPKLNGVCIAGNMQSEVKIIQYLLRPNRLEDDNPSKIAYIIIPYIDTDDWTAENKSYEKVRNIASQLRNVDETIEQKMVLSFSKVQKKQPDDGVEDGELESEPEPIDGVVLEENSHELNKIKLRLRYSKALSSKCSEEHDEYNYYRALNSTLNIKSKDEYMQILATNSNLISHPEDYFKSKGVWKTWYDFIGIDTTTFIQSKQDWINFCKEKNIKSTGEYYALCESFDKLPKDPAEFYKEFTNIPSELGFNRNRRR